MEFLLNGIFDVKLDFCVWLKDFVIKWLQRILLYELNFESKLILKFAWTYNYMI